MVNYVTKVESGLSKLLKDAANDITDGNISLKQKFRKIANVFINGNILSSQEAVYHALSLPLCFSSRTLVYINTVPIQNRCRMLKSKKDLPNLDKNSKNIYTENIFDKYEKRSVKLENICLADFACKFNHSKTLLNNNESEFEDDNNENNCCLIKERSKEKILRYYNYKFDVDKINYFREQVLLFVPFRNENNEIQNANCEIIYNNNKELIKINKEKYNKLNHNSLEQAMFDAETTSDDETDEEKCFSKEQNLEVDIFQQIGKEKDSDKKFSKFTKPDVLTKEQVFEMINNLNEEQKDIVMHIYNSFKTNNLPLRIFLSGSAGVGKSTVINAIYQLMSVHFNETLGEQNDNTKILLCAPSGKAAFLIGGITCHTAFALPVSQFSKQMSVLSADIANTIRKNFISVKLIIID